MYLRNRVVVSVYRLLYVLCCGAGLYINLGFVDGVVYPSAFIYYTNLSNILCFLYFVPLTLRTVTALLRGEPGTPTLMPRVKGMCTIVITVTIIVFHFILAGGRLPVYVEGNRFDYFISNLIMHYISPTMVILDWLLFSPKRRFRWQDPLIWAAAPICYVIAMLIRAEIGGIIQGFNSRFPYFFLDIDRLGWPLMLAYVAAIAVGFLAIGYAFVALDRIVLRGGEH